MKQMIREIMYDVRYIRGHKLQPAWFKLAKIFILLAGIGAYGYFFGWKKTLVLVLVFMLLSTVVHFAYRIKTEKFTKSWLDFQVREENGKIVNEPIGKYYYGAIATNAFLAVAVSQLLPL